MRTLSTMDLSFAAILILVLALLSIFLRLRIWKPLFIASLRTSIQLFFIGLILKCIFSWTHLSLVGLLALAMFLIATRESVVRQTRPLQKGWSYLLSGSSIAISSFGVTLFILFTVVKNEPWFSPQYSIPLLGMILGNTMNAVSLSLEHLFQTAWKNREMIEGRLSLGEQPKDAVHDSVRESIKVGLIPMFNAMAAAGVISLPGLMTGQILAGISPAEAVKYQIMIMFSIMSSAGFATIFSVIFGSYALFDKRERLRLDRLKPH